MRLYTFYTCPMSRFIEGLCDKNYRALIIEGEPTEVELNQGWADIVSLYTEKVFTPEQKMQLHLTRTVLMLQLTLQQINTILEALTKYYAAPLANQLNTLLNTRFVFDPSDKLGYYKTLQAAQTRSKGIQMNLNMKQDALKALEKKDKGTQVSDRDYFIKMKVALEDMSQIHFDFSSLTVAEYCERLSQAVQQSKKQSHAGRSDHHVLRSR